VIHEDSDVEGADASEFATPSQTPSALALWKASSNGEPAAGGGLAATGDSEAALGLGFQGKAAARLEAALQAGDAGRSLSDAIAAAFVQAWGLTPEMAQRLRALVAALRSN
ncbi:unnamed protein product, partial [Polarella glacialis]